MNNRTAEIRDMNLMNRTATLTLPSETRAAIHPALKKRRLLKKRVKEEKAACSCSPCANVSRVAAETRELPGKSTYRLLLAFVPCPRASESFRRALRPFLLHDTEARAQLDADSQGEESTDDGMDLEILPDAEKPPASPLFLEIEEEKETKVLGLDILPAYDDMVAWRRFRNYRAVQLLFTPHSTILNFHPLPRFHRARTDFTNGKHDYYVDDVIVNKHDDPARWPSPSSMAHWLWRPFDAPFKAKMTATSQLREIFYTHFITEKDVPRKPQPALAVLWNLFLQHITPQRINVLWAAIWELFITPGSIMEPSALGRLEVQFSDCAVRYQLNPGNGGELTARWQQIQLDILSLLTAEIETQWNENRDRGSAKHENYEKFAQHDPMSAEEMASLPLGFVRALVKLAERYDIFGSEVPIFDDVGHVVGCVDLILVDRVTGELLLADYKNCKDVDLQVAGNPRASGTHPFSYLMSDTKYSHYRLQLSMYRRILNTYYFPGRFVDELLLLNFRPSEPEAFYEYIMDPLDLDPLWALLPWNPDDPRHKQFPPPTTSLVPYIPDDDIRCSLGPTTGARLQKGDALPEGYVWTQKACKSAGFPRLEQSPWAHPSKSWFGTPTGDIPASYEAYLLNNLPLLHQLPELVGKKLVCWCYDPDKDRCNCEVLVKWANLYATGAFELPPLHLEMMKPVKEHLGSSRDAQRARKRKLARQEKEKTGNLYLAHDDGF